MSAVSPGIPSRNECCEGCCGGISGVCCESFGKKGCYCLTVFYFGSGVVKVVDYCLSCGNNLFLNLNFVFNDCCVVCVDKIGKISYHRLVCCIGFSNVFGKAVSLTCRSVLPETYCLMSVHKFFCFADCIIKICLCFCVAACLNSFCFGKFGFEVSVRDKFARCIEVSDCCLKCCICRTRSGSSIHCVTSDYFDRIVCTAVIVCTRSVVVDIKSVVNFDHVLLNYVSRRLLRSSGFDVDRTVFHLRECCDKSLEVIGEEYSVSIMSAVSPGIPCSGDTCEGGCGGICGVSCKSFGKKNGNCLAVFYFGSGIVKVVDYRLRCGDNLFFDRYFVSGFVNDFAVNYRFTVNEVSSNVGNEIFTAGNGNFRTFGFYIDSTGKGSVFQCKGRSCRNLIRSSIVARIFDRSGDSSGSVNSNGNSGIRRQPEANIKRDIAFACGNAGVAYKLSGSVIVGKGVVRTVGSSGNHFGTVKSHILKSKVRIVLDKNLCGRCGYCSVLHCDSGIFQKLEPVCFGPGRTDKRCAYREGVSGKVQSELFPGGDFYSAVFKVGE